MVGIELNAQAAPGGPLARILSAWFDGALGAVAAPEAARLAEQGPLPAESVRRNGVPCGPAGGLWGFFTVQRADGAGLSTSRRVYSVRNRSWFLAQLADPPRNAEFGMCVLDSEGLPGRTLHRATFEYGDLLAPGWLRLVMATHADAAARDDADIAGHEAAVLGFVRHLADLTNPSYGAVGDTGSGFATALEQRLKIRGHDAIPASRTRLRGYSWVTVLAEELSRRLGGAGALAASKAFTEVSPLADGGLWLRATQRREDYDAAAAERVRRALLPVFPPDQPADRPTGGAPGPRRRTAAVDRLVRLAATVPGLLEDGAQRDGEPSQGTEEEG